MKTTSLFWRLLSAAVMLVVISGCTDNPVTPSGDTNALPDASLLFSVTADQIQVSGTVADIDYEDRLLTLEESGETVVAAADCDIARIDRGVVVPIAFADIMVGDSLKACGVPQEDGTFLANIIRICLPSDCPDYDLAFRDTIKTIDYAAGTFTVSGRTETITTDGNTLIWGSVYRMVRHQYRLTDAENDVMELSKLRPDHAFFSRDTLLAFTDLDVGDVVEVKAMAVDPGSLLAVMIKVANCTVKTCVEFEATIATIDVPSRTVTFEDQLWTGLVCPGALLVDVDDNPLTLEDFAAGDLVAVKGFSIEGETLRICLMRKI